MPARPKPKTRRRWPPGATAGLITAALACTAIPWQLAALIGVLAAWAWRTINPPTPTTPAPQPGRERRCFTLQQRAIIYARADGRCQIAGCGRRVHWQALCPHRGCDDCYHADHIRSWRNGGLTTLANGRCGCRRHNLTRDDD